MSSSQTNAYFYLPHNLLENNYKAAAHKNIPARGHLMPHFAPFSQTATVLTALRNQQ